jgi:catechol 2,3-dioxygenase-like lactoylglutathione lyase family enzyme
VITVERTDFISVPVTDIERARSFYSGVLELSTPPTSGGFPEFQLGENVSVYLVDMKAIGQEFTSPHTAHIALRVPNVEEARRSLEEKGVQFDGDILDTGVCHMAFFRDPDGNALMLHRRYAPYKDGSTP